ncbi:MAG: AAA family ATPase [Methylocystis sp.]|uniref:AAA family ATPase n=1 Tax=Methylocystis sp. TaxID=1911079 RepID=UPI003DA26AF1
MHIVAFVSKKGGAGKSTLASNLAVAAHLAGQRVFICDLDPLQSLVKWSRVRQAIDIPVEHIPGQKLTRALAALQKSGVGLVVIDTPGAESACCLEAIDAADFCVIPARPNVLDLWASEETLARVRAAGKAYAFLLNQCPPARQGARLARGAEGLQEMGALLTPMVSARVDYQDAVRLGLGVTELRPDGAAAREMTQLWAAVQCRLDEIARDRLAARARANPVLASYREFFDQAARVSEFYADLLKKMLPDGAPEAEAAAPPASGAAETTRRRSGV